MSDCQGSHCFCRIRARDAETEIATLRASLDEARERVEAMEKALLNAQATVRACLEDDARDCSAADHAQGLCNCNALGTVLLLRPSPQATAGKECSHWPDGRDCFICPSEKPQATGRGCATCGGVGEVHDYSEDGHWDGVWMPCPSCEKPGGQGEGA